MTKSYEKFFLFMTLLFLPHFATAVVVPHKPPVLTTSAIIEVYIEDQYQGIVLIERGKAPFGKALPGGKVEYGETTEEAVRREMMEEVNLELYNLKQFHVYSDPWRDPRHHSIEVTYTAEAYAWPSAGDDAAQAFVYKLEEVPWKELAFDHAKIIGDYRQIKNGNTDIWQRQYFPR